MELPWKLLRRCSCHHCGAAISSIKIDGILHEFSTLPGF